MSDLRLTGCLELLNRHLLDLEVSEVCVCLDSQTSPTNANNSCDFEGLKGDAEDVQRLWKGFLIESVGEPSPASHTFASLFGVEHTPDMNFSLRAFRANVCFSAP